MVRMTAGGEKSGISNVVHYKMTEGLNMDKEHKCGIRTYRNTRNPILPVDIHIPDSEAHVMPDGKLYIYGSYDAYENAYCSEKYHVVSTPDMRNWNIYEESFHGEQVPWFNSPDALKSRGQLGKKNRRHLLLCVRGYRAGQTDRAWLCCRKVTAGAVYLPGDFDR